ncbi:MAG: hypothetical protein WBG50_23510 [Desulfomonilaceae bacterium]
MLDNRYTKDQTALPFVDSYNDFLSEDGKFHAAAKEMAVTA